MASANIYLDLCSCRLIGLVMVFWLLVFVDICMWIDTRIFNPLLNLEIESVGVRVEKNGDPY